MRYRRHWGLILLTSLVLVCIVILSPLYAQTADPEGDESGATDEPLKPPPMLWVDDVTGAPGDGNYRLTEQMFIILDEAGYSLARTPSRASYFVQGIVYLSVVNASTEQIEIVWALIDADGDEKGTISQQNYVPRGDLHGEWGQTAEMIARGGVYGVREILKEMGYAEPEILDVPE